MGGTTLHTYTLRRESGATLRGAGIHEHASEIDGQQWTRPSRPRDEKSVYDEPKLRWSEALPEIKAE